MDTRDDGSPIQLMRRLFWCSLLIFFVQVFSLCVAYGERRKIERQADVAKTQKSSAAARHPGRKVQEPECGPLHE